MSVYCYAVHCENSTDHRNRNTFRDAVQMSIGNWRLNCQKMIPLRTSSVIVIQTEFQLAKDDEDWSPDVNLRSQRNRFRAADVKPHTPMLPRGISVPVSIPYHLMDTTDLTIVQPGAAFVAGGGNDLFVQARQRSRPTERCN